MKLSIITAVFILMISFAGLGFSEDQASPSHTQKQTGICFVLNHCTGARLGQTKNALDCSSKGGSSWLSSTGTCHKNLEGDDTYRNSTNERGSN